MTESGSRREWATVDKSGHLQPWASETQAHAYVDGRVRLGSAAPGEERVVYRDVDITKWQPVVPADAEKITHEDGELYRAAVVVFVNVRSESDYTDASFLATRAVEHTLQQNGVVFRQVRGDLVWEVPVEIVDVMELATAAGNSHLVVTPTVRPYRQNGAAAGKLPEGIVRPYDPADEED
jgi:hypothetical protein